MAIVGTGGNRGYTNGDLSKSTYDKSVTSRETARLAHAAGDNTEFNDKVKRDGANWGSGASRGLYSTFSNLSGTEALDRDLLKSRLWKGVPQLTDDQMKAFEAAYTGHTFIFVVDVPRFMTQGLYFNTNLHQQIKNLKSIIERASTGFTGPSPITAEFDDQDDGNGRKMSHMTRVYKDQSEITLRLHEFAGLPVKNAIESWLTGVYDIYSQHGSYHGNLGISGGWCTANHTMSMLVVQTDPSWTEIQDAAYYYNMMPTEVPFDHFNWTKGESQIVQDYDIQFKCNEIRTPAIMYAAEKFMNARILSMVSTSVFNTRQFVPTTFNNGSFITAGFRQELGLNKDPKDNATIIDYTQFNTQIANKADRPGSNNTTVQENATGESFVSKLSSLEDCAISEIDNDKQEPDNY